MLTAVVMFSVAALASDHGASDERPTNRDASHRVISRRDDTVQQLAAEPLEIARTYDALAAKSKPDRMRAYAELSGSMRSAVWNHQLLVALAEHPEFTEEQRTVLFDAIELFTPEFFEIPFGSADWGSRVDQPLRKLERRAKATFGLALTAQLLAHLGPDKPTIAAEQAGVTPSSEGAKSQSQLRPAPNDLPNCSCSTSSDYCAVEWGSDWYCLGGGCIWGLNWGCGTALQYPCNGLCDLRKFQD